MKSAALVYISDNKIGKTFKKKTNFRIQTLMLKFKLINVVPSINKIFKQDKK